MMDYPDMDPYGDGGAYHHLSQGYSWDMGHRPASFSNSSIVRSSDADSDADSPANSTLYGASDVSEGLQRNSSRRALPPPAKPNIPRLPERCICSVCSLQAGSGSRKSAHHIANPTLRAQ